MYRVTCYMLHGMLLSSYFLNQTLTYTLSHSYSHSIYLYRHNFPAHYTQQMFHKYYNLISNKIFPADLEGMEDFQEEHEA